MAFNRAATFGLLAVCVGALGYDVGFKVSDVVGYQLLNTSQSSALYTAQLNISNAYDDPIYILDLHGDRYSMGFDYGFMLGQAIKTNYDTFLANLLGTSAQAEIERIVLEMAIDWQWSDYLSKQTPQIYLDEIRGMADGAAKQGIANADKMVSRMIVLANAPGDLNDFVYILIREWFNTGPNMTASTTKVKDPKGLQCSMFAIWGDRTVDGSLYSARNLDWNQDTGIARYKLITVYHPTGAIAHATLGYVGLVGALTGISAAGLTVHEANLEENEITFSGFPWLLRLRYIMEYASNLTAAKQLWESTNNTVGFNHMIASASDRSGLVEETMFGYTAYFQDNDPREKAATYKYSNGTSVPIGFPLPQAVWRTNHGYDPTIRAHYEWSQSPESWSMQRYMMFYNYFSEFESQGQQLTELDALTITAIVGDKGSATPYQCQNAVQGSNVLSATYHPAVNRMYAAWENGHKTTWRPACCNTYAVFDMSHWWNSQPIKH